MLRIYTVEGRFGGRIDCRVVKMTNWKAVRMVQAEDGGYLTYSSAIWDGGRGTVNVKDVQVVIFCLDRLHQCLLN